jgi:transketolase
MTIAAERLDQLAIDTIRTLSIDGVQKAKSGHPGAPMGMAPSAYVLFTRILRHAPRQPDWPNRDRFVLSAGHASMLLYSVLHLTGYDVTLDDLKSFRQWGSKTPGHPEYGLTPGVEATTGPLGQGFANGIGMAIAERRLAQEFNRPGHDVIDHRVYAICSDGDLQEGIASEAASLAGHLRLGKLIYLWDDNHIQLDGPTGMAWSEDVLERFDAYQWHTQRVEDGNDIDAIMGAIERAQDEERPSLIAVRTHIGYGSPNRQDSQKAHGQPLGDDEVRLTKEAYGWDPDKFFYVPDDVREQMLEVADRGEGLVAAWEQAFAAYKQAHGDDARELERRLRGDLPQGWDAGLKIYKPGEELATRNASQDVIQSLAPTLPELFGGAADLSESNLTDVKGAEDFTADEAGRNLRFGVREHGMGGVANGIAYHGGFIPYCATFLNFSDYMRGSVRLAAMSGLHVIYVWTHDSIGLGEDGPTHQPVEHYAALRAMPNLWFMRPGDANETAAAWRAAAERHGGPIALSLTRQKLPTLPGTAELARDGVRRGGYVLRESGGGPNGLEGRGPDGNEELILIATGSELALAMGAAEALEREGHPTRVVSLPCWELFEAQDQAYRDAVLPPTVSARVGIEVGASLGWEHWVGDRGAIVGLDHFGASAPAGTIFEKFGFTVERVADVARGVLEGRIRGPVPTLEPGHLPALGAAHGSHATGGEQDGSGNRPTAGATDRAVGSGSTTSSAKGSGVDRDASAGRDPGHD